MAVVVNSFAISGVDAYKVDIECDTIYGQPSVSIVGLGDAAIKEARERLEAAMINSKYVFPKMKIVINLAPGDIKKSGSHFDLGMAIGVLIQSKQIVAPELKSFSFIGELSLNGDLKPCTGALPMVIESRNKGICNIILPRGNIKEASLVKDINLFAFEKLRDVVDFLDSTKPYENLECEIEKSVIGKNNIMDFSEVRGQSAVIEFVVAAAAGGHNLLMTGVPGCGKSMIAKRLPTILPEMNEEEALQVTKIYSVAGLLKNKGSLIESRPFRAPHHNASMNSLIGGGNNAMPGEISLAHNGVLFLDEIAEFNKNTLDSLRQPLEDGNVTISRVKFTNTYPANFMLIAAMNTCPCGYHSTPRCKCTDYEVLRYRQKLSGPILDRIDIQKYIQPVNFIDISSGSKSSSSKELRDRVKFARDIQKIRFEKINGVNCNSQMSGSLIDEFCKIDEEGRKLLKLAFDKYSYSARSYNKFLKIARTFADLEGESKISRQNIAKALLCRDIDKEQANMVMPR